MKTAYYLLIFHSLVLGSCQEEAIENAESTQPEIGECQYQNFTEHCITSYDSTALNWRQSGRPCSYFNLSPENVVVVEKRENADWVILKEVPFWMTVNWELRVKKEVKAKCYDENGQSEICYVKQFSDQADKKGCQTICPETPIIIIPLGGLKSNLEKIHYEVIIHAFCGRILLFGGTVEK